MSSQNFEPVKPSPYFRPYLHVQLLDDDTEEEETRDEKALESVAAPTVKALGAGHIVWRHLSTTTSTAPRSWDSLRPYSLNNQLIVASSEEAGGVLYITQDEADVKEGGRSIIDWPSYASEGAEIWQPRAWRIIPLKNEDGTPALDDNGRPLVMRRPKKYGKIAVFNAARYPWLNDKRAAKLATIERRAKEEQQERDEKRAALLGDEPVLWVTKLAALVRRYFDQTKLTTERRELGEEIARYVIGARLGFAGMNHGHKDEASDAARILKIATQGDKKHNTVGHALQKILKHVNKCASAILYEKPAPVPTAPAPVTPAPADEDGKKRVEEIDGLLVQYWDGLKRLDECWTELRNAKLRQLEGDISERISAARSEYPALSAEWGKLNQRLANIRIVHAARERYWDRAREINQGRLF